MPGLRPPKEDLIPVLPLETEKKILKVTIVVTALASLLTVIAVATDYWLILTVIGAPHEGPGGRLITGSHSGLWRTCLDIIDKNSKEPLYNCTSLFDLMGDADFAKKQENTVSGGPAMQLDYAKTSMAFALVTLVFMALTHVFAVCAVRANQYMWKRITAVLDFITAVCVLICIQIVENSAESKEDYAKKVQGLVVDKLDSSFGFCYVVMWIVFVCYVLAGIAFLLLSKKRHWGPTGAVVDSDPMRMPKF